MAIIINAKQAMKQRKNSIDDIIKDLDHQSSYDILNTVEFTEFYEELTRIDEEVTNLIHDKDLFSKAEILLDFGISMVEKFKEDSDKMGDYLYVVYQKASLVLSKIINGNYGYDKYKIVTEYSLKEEELSMDEIEMLSKKAYEDFKNDDIHAALDKSIALIFV